MGLPPTAPVVPLPIGIVGRQYDVDALHPGHRLEGVEGVPEQGPAGQRQVLLGAVRPHAGPDAGGRPSAAPRSAYHQYFSDLSDARPRDADEVDARGKIRDVVSAGIEVEHLGEIFNGLVFRVVTGSPLVV